jgi:hypothetical protein
MNDPSLSDNPTPSLPKDAITPLSKDTQDLYLKALHRFYGVSSDENLADFLRISLDKDETVSLSALMDQLWLTSRSAVIAALIAYSREPPSVPIDENQETTGDLYTLPLDDEYTILKNPTTEECLKYIRDNK